LLAQHRFPSHGRLALLKGRSSSVGGEIVSELDLSRNRRIEVPGPLGITAIVVDKRRVRVASDPGPRQYCVRQGWLARAGEIAICAPNQVSVEIQGGRPTYDSLSY
jgi:hypothetical protein